MYFHAQNLTDGWYCAPDGTKHQRPLASILRYGRCWWRLTDRWLLNLEWCFFKQSSLSAHVDVFSGDGNNAVGCHISVPWLMSLHATLEGVFSRAFVERRFKKVGYEADRSTGFFLSDGLLHWEVWRPDMAGWSKEVPWWRSHGVYMPWNWWHVRNDILRPDGSVFKRVGRDVSPHDVCTESFRTTVMSEVQEIHPYTYTLNDGTVQHRTATIHGEEREWRLQWFTWSPWPRMVRRTINVEFDDEVGERTGSWKGGYTGCSYEWKHGETMLSSLKRMEATRKFD